MPVATLLPALRSRFPEKRLLTERARLAPYTSDALTAFREQPEAVVLVESKDEVVDLVRLCHQEGVPFVARGSGTSLSGGSLPVPGGIVIGLNRLNRVLEVDPVDAVAVVEPGVINAHVTAAAAKHGLIYAPDPSSQSVCTIGGNIAFNSGGAHCLKYGMTSNHVLSVEVVLPYGEVVRLGSRSVEPTGPDWVGLFVGSEGLFGIVLEATLRLLPAPEATRTVLAAYPSLAAAGEAVTTIIAAGVLPVAMEIMDALAIRAAESSVRPGYPVAAALLIVELDGEHAVVEADFERLQAAIRTSNATEVREARDAEERAAIWRGRKGAFSAVGWLAPDYIVQDGCVPRSRLGEALTEIGRLSQKGGLEIANVFHAGDGNLHPLILFDGREPGALERAEGLAGEILDLCVRLGGSITGEHGVGVEKKAYLGRMFSSTDLGVMRRLRASIDPAELANRGKMLPADDAPEEFSGARARDGDALAAHPEVLALQAALLDARSTHARVLPRGGGTKPALSRAPDGVVTLDVGGLRGIVQHDPGEFTITALAGTPVRELEQALAGHGERLPFDPPLAAAGATIGGVVASGTSGPGRHRFGGVRDFVIAVRFLSGTAELVTGGCRVVKNAAGFDLPKLMAGSLGRLGVMVELSLKVLPAPPAWGTLAADAGDLPTALEAITRLRMAGIDVEALDLVPPGRLRVRLGGPPEGLEARLARVLRVLDIGAGEQLLGAPEEQAWSEAREFAWAPPGGSVLKLSTTPTQVPRVDELLAASAAARRYSSGASLCWVAWPRDEPLRELDSALSELGVSGLRLAGPPGPPLIGLVRGGGFADRSRLALDPDELFAEV